MYCSHCGNPIVIANAKFCSKCGGGLTADAALLPNTHTNSESRPQPSTPRQPSAFPLDSGATVGGVQSAYNPAHQLTATGRPIANVQSSGASSKQEVTPLWPNGILMIAGIIVAVIVYIGLIFAAAALCPPVLPVVLAPIIAPIATRLRKK